MSSTDTRSVGGRGHTTAQSLCSPSHCPLSPSGGHHFLIPIQNGITSDGECKYCGYQKILYNQWPGDGNGARRDGKGSNEGDKVTTDG